MESYKALRTRLPDPVLRSHERALHMWLAAEQITKRYLYGAGAYNDLAEKMM